MKDIPQVFQDIDLLWSEGAAYNIGFLIESAVRRVVNLRLKGNGLLWLEANAEAVLVMRAAVLTGRWQETLQHMRQTMASDRRLDWQWASSDMPADLKAKRLIKPPEAQTPTKQRPHADVA